MTHPLSRGTVAVEDLQSLLGGVIEVDFSVGEDLKQAFERATMLDQVYGVELEVERDLVEGFLLVSLVDALTHPYLQLDPERWVGLNYGLDRVRFLKTARITDLLRLRAEVTEVAAKGPGYLVKLNCSFHVIGEGQPVLAAVADWLVFAAPRSEGGVVS